MNKFLKTLTLLTFLTVIIPGDKLSFPVGIALILPFLGITPAVGILLAVLPLIAITLICVTLFHRKPDPEDALVTLISVIVFWAYLLFFIKNFLAYSSSNTYLTLGAFIILSAACFTRNLNLFRKLRKRETNL